MPADDPHVLGRFQKIITTLKTEGFPDLALHVEGECKPEVRLGYMQEVHVSSWRSSEESRALLRALSFLRLQNAQEINPAASKYLLRGIHADVVKDWSGKYERNPEKVRHDLRESATELRTTLQLKLSAQRAERERIQREKSLKAHAHWKTAVQHAQEAVKMEKQRRREFDLASRFWLYPYGIFPETPFRPEDVSALVTKLNTEYSGLAAQIVADQLDRLRTRFYWGIDSLEAAESFQDEIFEEIRQEKIRQREFVARLVGGIIGAGLSAVLGPLGPAIGAGISSALGGVLGSLTQEVATRVPQKVGVQLTEFAQKRIEDAVTMAREKSTVACAALTDKVKATSGDAVASRIVGSGPATPDSLAQQVRVYFDQQYEGIQNGIVSGILEICGSGAFVGEMSRAADEATTAAARAQEYKAIDYLWEVHSMTRQEIAKMAPLMSSAAQFNAGDASKSHCSDGLLQKATGHYVSELVRALAQRLRQDFALGQLPEAPQAKRDAHVAPLTALWKAYLLALYVENEHGFSSDDGFALPVPMYEKYKTDWFTDSTQKPNGTPAEKLKFENRTSGTMRVTNVNDPVRMRAWLYYIKENVNPCDSLFTSESPEKVLQRVQRAATAINQFVEEKKSGKRGPKESYPTITTLVAFVKSPEFARLINS